MLITINKFLKIVLLLPRPLKQVIALFLDLGLCILCVWLAFYLRLDKLFLINGPVLIAALVSIFLALPVFWFLGLYRTIFRYSGLDIMFSVSIAFLFYGVLYFFVIGVYGINDIPRSIVLFSLCYFFSELLFLGYL